MRLVAPGFITGNEHPLAIFRRGLGTEIHSRSSVELPTNVNRGMRSNAEHPRKKLRYAQFPGATNSTALMSDPVSTQLHRSAEYESFRVEVIGSECFVA